MEFQLCVPCLFGLEGLVGNELRHMGLRSVAPENGRVYCAGSPADLARVNVRSRFGERVLLVLGRFDVSSFDALFEGVRALPWEEFIPRHGAFLVKGWALESALHSVPDCQRIVKKAVAARLGSAYGLERLPEDGETYQIQFGILKDRAALYLDSSGIALYKRGYRSAQVAAPLRETLAAALVDIAGYRGKGAFCDPFCGSGTIAIEAAMAAKGRAPGLTRSFAAEAWGCLEPGICEDARAEARSREFSREYTILASDIDPRAVELARSNARRAGVEELIRFETADARDFSLSVEDGVLCTNPPYGERMLEKQEAGALYAAFGAALRRCGGWRLYVLSAHPSFEQCFGKSAVKRRRLYNGMLPCSLYMYY